MKKNEHQKARSLVVFGILIVPAIIVALLYFGYFSKKERLTDKVAGVRDEAKASVSGAASTKVISVSAFAPVSEDDGGMAPETRAALEKAGLQDVKLSPLAFSVQARKPVIVGSALLMTGDSSPAARSHSSRQLPARGPIRIRFLIWTMPAEC